MVVDVRLVEGSGSTGAFQALVHRLQGVVGLGLGAGVGVAGGSAPHRTAPFPRMPDPPPLVDDAPNVHLAASVSDEPTMV